MTFVWRFCLYLYFSFLLKTVTNYDLNATLEYERIERGNYVFREDDQYINFYGNESVLPQSFLFQKYVASINDTPEDPFDIKPISRNIAESRDRKVYEADWLSLSSRTLPTWFDEAKVGIFVHWGVYSVPAFGLSNQYNGFGEWFLMEWQGRKNSDFMEFMEKAYEPGFEYKDFVPLWKAEFFNATEWANLVEESGAKYFVMTTKHHDGYTLWKSNVSEQWNSVESGPKRDIIAELAEAFEQKKGMHFGLYYSLYEWFHPLYLRDKRKNFTTQEFVEKIVKPQLYDIVMRYKPEYIWSDGDWETGYEYWNSTEFLAWLYNDSPVRETVLVNDRWGVGTACKHGDVKTCGIDRYNPRKMQEFKWENAMTIDHHSWGFRRNAKLDDYLTMYNLTAMLAETVSLGGNLLMNVGPNADGTIAPIYQERLREMGSWLKVNGEGIYGTKPWREQNDTSDMRTWYTTKDNTVYAIVLDWPVSRIVTLVQPTTTVKTKVFLLGNENELVFTSLTDEWGLKIDVTHIGPANLPCKYAWVFRLTDVK